MDDYKEQLITEYHSLEPIFREESPFWALLEELRKESYKTVREGEEQAKKCYYYIRAVDKLEGALKSLATRYVVETRTPTEE